MIFLLLGDLEATLEFQEFPMSSVGLTNTTSFFFALLGP